MPLSKEQSQWLIAHCANACACVGFLSAQKICHLLSAGCTSGEQPELLCCSPCLLLLWFQGPSLPDFVMQAAADTLTAQLMAWWWHETRERAVVCTGGSHCSDKQH